MEGIAWEGDQGRVEERRQRREQHLQRKEERKMAKDGIIRWMEAYDRLLLLSVSLFSCLVHLILLLGDWVLPSLKFLMASQLSQPVCTCRRETPT